MVVYIYIYSTIFNSKYIAQKLANLCSSKREDFPEVP